MRTLGATVEYEVEAAGGTTVKVLALRLASEPVLALGQPVCMAPARSGCLHGPPGEHAVNPPATAPGSPPSSVRRPAGAGGLAEHPLVLAMLSSRGMGPALPALVYLLVFLVVPLGLLFSFAFLTVDRGEVVPGSLSLEHFARTLGDDLFWRIAWRSLWVGALSTLLCFVLAYPLAYLYTTLGALARKLLLVAIVAPLLTSALVRTYAWIVILGGRKGLANSILMELDLVRRPLRILNTDWSVLIGMTQIHLPFMILPLIAVLVARETEIENASLNLGAGRVRTFFRVTLPLSVPGSWPAPRSSSPSPTRTSSFPSSSGRQLHHPRGAGL